MADALTTRVAAAQALAAAATPGPWKAGSDWIAVAGPEFKLMIQAGLGADENATGCDLDLMAAAPDLAALVAELWAEVDKLRTACLLLDESRKHTVGERDEARAEVARLRALLPTAGPAWGEHCAGLGDITSLTDKEG